MQMINIVLEVASQRQVNITHLGKKFIMIGCVSLDLKYFLLHKFKLFFNGYTFHFFYWYPNFDPFKYKLGSQLNQLCLGQLPTELIDLETLVTRAEYFKDVYRNKESKFRKDNLMHG